MRTSPQDELLMLDANRDGAVSEAEFSDASAVLMNRLDRDGNGVITAEDFGGRRPRY